MSGTTIGYGYKAEQLRQTELAKAAVCRRMMNHPLGHPAYYGVCYYGKRFKPNPDLTAIDRWRLSPTEFRKRWDLSEVRKTQDTITKFINKSFGDDVPVYWFIEKHSPQTDEDGDDFKDGHYHSNIFVGEISDEAIEDPSPFLMPLFHKEDEAGIPISMRNASLPNLKLLLLNVCIRQAKWVGSHPSSLWLQAVPPEEMEQTISYCMKEINENPATFNRVIDKSSNHYLF